MPLRPKTRQRTKQGNSIIPKYKLSSGMIAGMLGGSSDSPNGVVQANQMVSPEYQPEGYGGPAQYYGKGGQVTEQPFMDTRNWWQRNITRRPNVAGEMNLGIQGQVAQQRALQPGELNQRRALEDIELQSEMMRLQQQEEFGMQNAPVQNPLYRNPSMAEVQEPGQVPFSFQGDPQQAIYDRDKPFSGENASSRLANAEIAASGEKDRLRNVGNIQQQFGLSPGNELTPPQMEVIQGMRDLEKRKTEAGITELSRPRTGTLGNYLVNLDTGDPMAYATGEHKIEGGPIIKDGKVTGFSPESYTKPSFQRMSKPVGNAYGNGQKGGYSGPMARPSNQQYYTPMSGQTEYFPEYQDGQKVAETPSQGSAPVTSPPEVSVLSRPVANNVPIDASPFFTPEMQSMAEQEYKRRLIQKLQNQAWNPIDYSRIYQ